MSIANFSLNVLASLVMYDTFKERCSGPLSDVASALWNHRLGRIALIALPLIVLVVTKIFYSRPRFVAMPKFLENMNDCARRHQYTPCVGRDDDIGRIMRTVRQANAKSLVLLGPPGIGKSAIFEELARRINAKDPSVQPLHNKTLYSLDVSRLIGVEHGSYVGTLQQSVTQLLRFTEASQGKALVVIDELNGLRGAGRYHGNHTDVLDMLLNALARDQIVIFGTANTDKWKPIIDEDRAVQRRFTSIYVAPPSSDRCLEMLTYMNTQGGFTRELDPIRVNVSEPAMVAAIRLTEKHIPTEFLPNKAIKLICTTVIYCQDEAEQADLAMKTITAQDIAGCLYDSLLGGRKGKMTRPEFIEQNLALSV